MFSINELKNKLSWCAELVTANVTTIIAMGNGMPYIPYTRNLKSEVVAQYLPT